MKRVLVLIVCLLAAPSPSYAEPAIHFDHTRYDFPVIPQGETAEHTFEFSNSGDRELVIEKMIPS